MANRRRLQMFRNVLKHPGSSVSETGDALSLTGPVASQYLRLLNARGLLRVVRTGRRVEYRVMPNPSIPETDPMIEALSATFQTAADPIRTIFRQLTGFTHPRRIQIVRILFRRPPLHFTELRIRTGISREALRRHLNKLLARGLIVRMASGYRCARPKAILPSTLLRLAAGQAME